MSKTIKFNAGKVEYDEETKKCTPLPHKGQVVIKPSAEEEDFFSFQWTPKSNSGNVERDDLLIIPGDVTFKHVKSCKSGRVFALTFLSSGAKNLYWLQDIGDDEQLDQLTEKDKELLASVQSLVALEEDEEEPEKEPVVEAAQETKRTPAPITAIDDVLTFEVIEKHLSSLSEKELEEKYGDLLPEGVKPTKEEIARLVRNGFFKQANKELSSTILNNGVGQILASSLGYDYQGEGIEAFLEGLRKSK